MRQHPPDAVLQGLIEGVTHFQTQVFHQNSDLFKTLAEGQDPKVLFITCSDSRIDTSMMTQTTPGELFIIRNAGNIVPPHGLTPSGETASIEFALSVLYVSHVIICGHSHCGAMKAVLNPDSLHNLPTVENWLLHAEATKAILAVKGREMSESERMDLCIQENVLVQLNHLKTLPTVASRLAKVDLSLHGWVYHFETGEVLAYDYTKEQFRPLAEVYTTPPMTSCSL